MLRQRLFDHISHLKISHLLVSSTLHPSVQLDPASDRTLRFCKIHKYKPMLYYPHSSLHPHITTGHLGVTASAKYCAPSLIVSRNRSRKDLNPHYTHASHAACFVLQLHSISNACRRHQSTSTIQVKTKPSHSCLSHYTPGCRSLSSIFETKKKRLNSCSWLRHFDHISFQPSQPITFESQLFYFFMYSSVSPIQRWSIFNKLHLNQCCLQ